MSKRFLRWFLLLLLVADTTYSFVQHVQQPLDGDMAGGVVPDEHTKRVLADPFALSVIRDDATYANPNRFFAHWTFLQYFRNAPLLLQHFTDPVSSAYLACAIAKTIIQLLLLFLLAVYISGTANVWRTEFLLPAALLFPLFQVNGYCGVMGIIDPSITYTFFYALPLALLLLFYLPYFLFTYHGKSGMQNRFVLLLLAGLAVFLSLNGPLLPGLIAVVTLLYFSRELPGLRVQTDAPQSKRFMWLFAFTALLAGYSIYTSSNNVLLTEANVGLLQRYARLPAGLFHLLTNKLALPLLLAMIALNFFLIRKNFRAEGGRIFRLAKWIGLGALVYILVLPLGGYRTYRPDILRHDTFMPVTIGLMLLYGMSAVFLVKHSGKKWYTLALVVFSLIFFLADAPELGKNREERQSFAEIAASPGPVVEVQRSCTILAWGKITDPKDSRLNGELLYYWRITKEPKRYYQK